MSDQSRPLELTVALSPADYHAYTSAARLLIRVMGRKAPDALALIRHTLGGRDATGIVDDYLDSVAWPTTVKDAAGLRRAARPSPQIKPTVATQPRVPLPRLPAGFSPIRN
jgi:hypothetical protein